MKFIIFLSNSGGHIIPGLTFGNYLKKSGHSVMYVASKQKTSENLIKEECVWIESNSLTKKSITDIKMLKKIVNKYDIVIGFGGYVSLLGSILAPLCKKNLYLFEANNIIGESNKVGKIFAKKIFSYYKFNSKKIIDIGSPVEDDFRMVKINRDLKKVLLLGGSNGSSVLCEKYYNLANKNKDINFYMALGTNGEKGESLENLKVKKYVDRKEYCNFDVVISRAGGTTIAEIIKCGIPLVLIPSPYVKNDHQHKNAYSISKLANVSVVEECDEVTLNNVLNSLKSYEKRKAINEEYQRVCHLNVCQNALDLIIKYEKH